MKKRIMKLIVSFLIVFAFMCFIPTNVKAVDTSQYSAEEKAAAKAWLSAHGYSPTMDGAMQAYNDYLNGMWGGPGGNSSNSNNNNNNNADNNQNTEGESENGAEQETSADTTVAEGVQPETPAEVVETPLQKPEPTPLSPEAEKIIVSMFEDVKTADDDAAIEKVLKSEYDELEQQVDDKDQQIEELLAKQKELEEEQARLEAEKKQQDLERQKAEEEVARTKELVAKRQKQVGIAAVIVIVIAGVCAFVYFKKKK